jgi:hypothetical protein
MHQWNTVKTPTVFLFFACTVAFGYEPSLINCIQPADQLSSTIQATVEHRFSQALEDPIATNIFGTASVDMEVAARIWKGLEVSTAYFTDNNEFDLTGRYSQPVMKGLLDVGGELQFFNFDTHIIGRASNDYYLASIAVHPFSDKLYMTVQEGYDGFYLYSAPSASLLVKCTSAFDLIGEYTLGHDKFRGMTQNAWSTGVKLNTWGHQFKFIISNSTAIGSRNAAAGAVDNKIRLGFSIERLFRFTED